MASGQQRAEHDASQRQRDTGDNNLECLAKEHRGERTKGEHLGVPGYQDSKGYEENKGHRGDQTKEHNGTRSDEKEDHGKAGGAPAIDEGIDIDESTG